jgi:hypothetical protein
MENKTLLEFLSSELQLEELQPHQKEEVVAQLASEIMQRITITIASMVTEEEAGTLTQMHKDGKISEAFTLLTHNHPELEELLKNKAKEVVTEFKNA